MIGFFHKPILSHAANRKWWILSDFLLNNSYFKMQDEYTLTILTKKTKKEQIRINSNEWKVQKMLVKKASLSKVFDYMNMNSPLWHIISHQINTFFPSFSVEKIKVYCLFLNKGRKSSNFPTQIYLLFYKILRNEQ